MLMNEQITVKEAYQLAPEPKVEYQHIEKPATSLSNYYKIQILYITLWTNKSLNVKQREMVTAKDGYLSDTIFGVNSGFQFAQQNWGSFDPKEKRLLNTKQYFRKPVFPDSKAFFVDLKDDGKLLEKIPESIKNQTSKSILETDAEVFHK